MAFGKGLDGATGVGEVTLARWRSWGLFPKGARTFHGRHKGTGAFLYPPIAAEIIRVLRALPRLDRGVDAAFWALWLGGYTIDIGKWAAHRLAATQKKAEQDRGVRHATSNSYPQKDQRAGGRNYDRASRQYLPALRSGEPVADDDAGMLPSLR